MIANSEFDRFIRRYMDDIADPTLSMPEGFALAAYKEQLTQRFSNTSFNHKPKKILTLSRKESHNAGYLVCETIQSKVESPLYEHWLLQVGSAMYKAVEIAVKLTLLLIRLESSYYSSIH